MIGFYSAADQTGTSQIADVVEDPGMQLDFVYRRDITIGERDMTLGLSARNLLGEKNEEFQLNGGELGGPNSIHMSAAPVCRRV